MEWFKTLLWLFHGARVGWMAFLAFVVLVYAFVPLTSAHSAALPRFLGAL